MVLVLCDYKVCFFVCCSAIRHAVAGEGTDSSNQRGGPEHKGRDEAGTRGMLETRGAGCQWLASIYYCHRRGRVVPRGEVAPCRVTPKVGRTHGLPLCRPVAVHTAPFALYRISDPDKPARGGTCLHLLQSRAQGRHDARFILRHGVLHHSR